MYDAPRAALATARRAEAAAKKALEAVMRPKYQAPRPRKRSYTAQVLYGASAAPKAQVLEVPAELRRLIGTNWRDATRKMLKDRVHIAEEKLNQTEAGDNNEEAPASQAPMTYVNATQSESTQRLMNDVDGMRKRLAVDASLLDKGMSVADHQRQMLRERRAIEAAALQPQLEKVAMQS